MIKHYLITIQDDDSGKWSFTYTGNLPWLKRWMLRVCGFGVKEKSLPLPAEGWKPGAAIAK